jgi:hypothetical protein
MSYRDSIILPYQDHGICRCLFRYAPFRFASVAICLLSIHRAQTEAMLWLRSSGCRVKQRPRMLPVSVPTVLLLMASRTVTNAAPMALRTCFVDVGMTSAISRRSAGRCHALYKSVKTVGRKIAFPSSAFSLGSPRMVSSLAGAPASKDTLTSSSLEEQLNVEVLRAEGRIVTLKVGTEGEGTLLQGAQLQFENGASGVVLYQRTPLLFALADSVPNEKPSGSDAANSDFGSSATLQLKSNRTTSVGNELVGRVVNFKGEAADGRELLASGKRAIFSPATLQQDLATISQPLHTGFTAIDALTPIGRGQNMLLIGGEEMGRLDIAIDTVVNQGREGVKCVYVSTNGRHAEVEQRLRASGAMAHTTLVKVDSSPDDAANPGECVLAAAVGCSIAEQLRQGGKDTLVVVDDLEAHRRFWDYTDRVLIQAACTCPALPIAFAHTLCPPHAPPHARPAASAAGWRPNRPVWRPTISRRQR